MLSLFKKKSNPQNVPECWIEYLSHFDKKQNLDKPISQTRFVILDVESNGLNPKKDKILSIGAVKVINYQIYVDNTLEIFLDQNEFNPEAVPIHGILKNGTSLKESEQIAMKKLVKYICNDIIVGHSVKFDVEIINETLRNYVNDQLKNRQLDTVELYKRMKSGDFKMGDSTSLDNLCDEFNIPKSDRHTAAGDALITAILFIKILSRLKKRGVITTSDLLKRRKLFI